MANTCNVQGCRRWATRYVQGLTDGENEDGHAAMCSPHATAVKERGAAVRLKHKAGLWRLDGQFLSLRGCERCRSTEA